MIFAGHGLGAGSITRESYNRGWQGGKYGTHTRGWMGTSPRGGSLWRQVASILLNLYNNTIFINLFQSANQYIYRQLWKLQKCCCSRGSCTISRCVSASTMVHCSDDFWEKVRCTFFYSKASLVLTILFNADRICSVTLPSFIRYISLLLS